MNIEEERGQSTAQNVDEGLFSDFVLLQAMYLVFYESSFLKGTLNIQIKNNTYSICQSTTDW